MNDPRCAPIGKGDEGLYSRAGDGECALTRPRQRGGVVEGVSLGRCSGTWSVTRAQARAYQAKGHE